MEQTPGNAGVTDLFLNTAADAEAWLAAQPPLASIDPGLVIGSAWSRRLVEAVVLLSEKELVAMAATTSYFPAVGPDTSVRPGFKKTANNESVMVELAGPSKTGGNNLMVGMPAGKLPGLSGLEELPLEVLEKAFSALSQSGFHKRLEESLQEALLRHAADLDPQWPQEIRAWQLDQRLPQAAPRRAPAGPRF